ncbi:hypothetical protein A2422_01125 [Candidatus Woesebacteria bacterium RIFOXYC1_FULL_31_51]|uniref:Uncharacterized protein n=1 Tax=Candidatus Woesebacteria bacterium GW2011_GWC2_31_9 TaxID=1618586 RepID=A0A0F9YJM7_9BACT|nr:MAG: hypothetical protein UR17_C0001G0675 [Candidatus Woesebacteria bacterium GW2011_GWF1_31_35]KKP22712.1 MAG: hypothetical protein UR11_C0002G0092 [Candidatus Woesebacteria bacterium GW2011_GWC1_30_29]KKP25905.1 MAG: hypothetical protein UR13_C0006G0044 [Candidatus Woesebacteria bacterium GW2011_GWD1_31_12]KKP27132.1 MAG: hypothetical protein UR16_C0006G0021 [Candidatus Woesebacteria bacterium GW2011_GWB1_31_29]KKP31498.1 MAG: hypothetical protein UR21_C0009G0079 [Candidatus Woesebacteria 
MSLTNKDINIIDNLLDRRLDKRFLEQEDKFDKKLTEFKSEFFDRIDPILKEVVASREERTLISEHLSDHSDRIETLEKIHSKGKHSLLFSS